MSKQNYYEFFGLSNFESDQKKIKAAYRSMALKWHPDRCHDKSKGDHVMKQVNEIYRVLSTCKESYDRHLKQKLGTEIKENPFKFDFEFTTSRTTESQTFNFDAMAEILKRYSDTLYQQTQTKIKKDRHYFIFSHEIGCDCDSVIIGDVVTCPKCHVRAKIKTEKAP